MRNRLFRTVLLKFIFYDPSYFVQITFSILFSTMELNITLTYDTLTFFSTANFNRATDLEKKKKQMNEDSERKIDMELVP